MSLSKSKLTNSTRIYQLTMPQPRSAPLLEIHNSSTSNQQRLLGVALHFIRNGYAVRIEWQSLRPMSRDLFQLSVDVQRATSQKNN
jgi:hypothetical protein